MTRAAFAALVLVLSPALAAAGGIDPAAEPLAIRASVWGQVNDPGLYELHGSPDVLELVSTAGGPTASADLGRVVLIRERDGTRQRINLVRLASSGRPLFLVPGDVVIVPQSFWSRFRSELPVVTTVVAIANVALTLVLMTQR